MSAIFSSVISLNITFWSFMGCIITSILIGAAIAFTYMKTSKRYTNSFVTTLAMLPAVVMVVIMMVNGNLGAGVAVAGAFSLVRFRSIPGTAKEIGYIFIALAAGLSTGMGYIAFAILFTLIMCGLGFGYTVLGFGGKAQGHKKSLTVVIPESLDYTGVFNDVFKKYLSSCELINVKTTNMGSLFKLKYEIALKDPRKEKEFIDELRTRNGNLEIICSRAELNQEIL
ncbi:MAG: DUF4956 domain-containing protein [Clostridia bacterium]|nr:DUF4956 domain-containing protein [Clostridia bacterium]